MVANTCGRRSVAEVAASVQACGGSVVYVNTGFSAILGSRPRSNPDGAHNFHIFRGLYIDNRVAGRGRRQHSGRRQPAPMNVTVVYF